MNKVYLTLLLGIFLSLSVNTFSWAKESWDLLGGELAVEGYVRSEAREKVAGNAYLTGWIQRLQVEASMNFENVGPFDEFNLVTIIRPEYDVAYNHGRTFNNGHVGRNAKRPSYLGSSFSAQSDPIGFNGFGAGFATGGLAKNVSEGVWNPNMLRQFEVLAGNSGFPLVAPLSDAQLDCKDCTDVNLDHTDIALGRTDSSGRLYPFRELYVDGFLGDWWVRFGKQQLVWGKTDFFRMQDIINPVDFGPHFFLDPFEDIRIPQWIFTTQKQMGDIGPLTDTSVQLVWNFDQFQPTGLGNHSQAWAHPFGKQKGTFAVFNTYFSPEPCVSATTSTAPAQICTPGDGRLPSGFGVPVGLSEDRLPAHTITNTELGGRFEFKWKNFFVALSHYYGWNDSGVFRFDSVNVNTAAVPGLAGLTNDALVVDLPSNTTIPVAVMDPKQAIAAAAAADDADAMRALSENNARHFYSALAGPGAFKVLGGQTSVVYKQSHTTGLSFDYFHDPSGVVLRVESSYTFDELVNNTRKANWLDTSDVLRYSIGVDRPTWIRFLNPNRTFFLSAQFFDTYYLNHEGGNGDGYFVQKHNPIYTFFAQTQYFRDQLIPSGFLVFEQTSQSFVSGATLEWLIDNSWSVLGGFNVFWTNKSPDDLRHDVGPFTSFTLDGDYRQQAVFGYARQGIGAFRNNDEVFLRMQYRF